jgi:hypothetical protein
VARNNPHWQATQRWAARRAVTFFQENGFIGGPGTLIWKRLGLL